jgi:hypothetical protein
MRATPGIGLLLLLAGCNKTPDAKSGAVARVGDAYLMREELAGLVPAGTPKADSIVTTRRFIDNWAEQKLLIKNAEVNLDDKKKAGLDKLIRQYRTDLYTRSYMDDIVRRAVDTTVSDEELAAYYRANRENFRTGSVLVRLRYIRLAKDNPKLAAIEARFFNFRKSDRKFWDNALLQSKSAALNDTVWTDMGQVYGRLPFVTPENRDTYIVPGKTIRHQEGADMYFVKISGVLERNQISPYEYVKPTLREVIVNMRKLEAIKKFEKDITDDAIKNKDYEIYR